MKKTLSILLVLLMLLSLCACGNNKSNSVEEKLQFGAWRSEKSAGALGTMNEVYTFLDNGKVQHDFWFEGGNKTTEKATYTIDGDVIVVTYPSGQVIKFGYNMVDNELSIYFASNNQVLTHVK